MLKFGKGIRKLDIVLSADGEAVTGDGSASLPAAAGTATTTTTALSGQTGLGRRRPIFEEFPVQSTTEAFGIDSLLTSAESTEISCSDKSATFRGIVNGRDLAWRQVDRNGLPKHSEWSLDKIIESTENEIKAYCHLREEWGKLVPHLVLRGPDFNSLWVTVTTYEGMSLQQIVDVHHSLSRETKESALHSLRALHGHGVLHGDVELRNAVVRELDGTVLWVDLEFAALREDGVDDFEAKAEKEMTTLQKLLDGIIPLDVDRPPRRSRSAAAKRTRIVPSCCS